MRAAFILGAEMGELGQERQESVTSDGGGEFEEFELALSAEHVITAYDENDELTHVVITGLVLETLQATVGYAPKLVRCAPQGLLQVWYTIDDVCKGRGWNWSRESPTLTYCKIYARPDGANEPYVRIDFDAEGVGSPDYLNFFDTGDPRARDKWADASSFIEAVKALIFIGLGYGTKTPFLESYFERLIKSPDSTVNTKNKRESISEKTRSRAAVFKQIKDKNPHLSYGQVATRANLDFGNELDKIVAEYDVRNAYIAMGWEWKRADRIR